MGRRQRVRPHNGAQRSLLATRVAWSAWIYLGSIYVDQTSWIAAVWRLSGLWRLSGCALWLT